MADRIKNYQQEADQITTLKAIRTDLGVTPSSYTPDATVVTKDRVVTFAQAEEELVVLSDIEKGVKQQIVDVDIAQKDISNIKALLQGNLYDYDTDDDTAYTKSVPAGAMPYAGLESLGGKTLVMNQSIHPCNTTYWAAVVPSNVSCSSTDDVLNCEVLVESFTPTETNRWQVGAATGNRYSFTNGHKYYIHFEINQSSAGGVHTEVLFGSPHNIFSVPNANTWTDCSVIQTAESSNNGNFLIMPWLDDYTGFTYKIRNAMLVDLTLMFGAGNEPSTVAEIRQMFPAQYYQYLQGQLLSAGVTEVVSKDSNNATLQTYSIPASIRNLEGYGWSAGTAYNYIDFERKVFVQNVGSRAYASGDESDSTVVTDGTTTYYPLNTPVETDISEYLTDDNLIQVEAGGTLTFPNQNGTDYQIPVPSEETYMIDLQSAIGG